MSISNHDPVEIEFEKEFPVMKSLVESFEKKIESGEDKFNLLLGLKDLRDRIYDLQLQQFGTYIGRDALPANISPQEEEIIGQILDLENRIDRMMREV